MKGMKIYIDKYEDKNESESQVPYEQREIYPIL